MSKLTELIDRLTDPNIKWYPLTEARCLELAKEYEKSDEAHHKRLATFYSNIPKKVIINPNKRGTSEYTTVLFDKDV